LHVIDWGVSFIPFNEKAQYTQQSIFLFSFFFLLPPHTYPSGAPFFGAFSLADAAPPGGSDCRRGMALVRATGAARKAGALSRMPRTVRSRINPQLSILFFSGFSIGFFFKRSSNERFLDAKMGCHHPPNFSLPPTTHI
jgi:hypothetical protein